MKKLVDINVSLGVWPFQRFACSTGAELAVMLKDAGIGQALVSHLGGVFNADVSTFNLELIDSVSSLPGMHPVPLVNPAIPGWDRHLDDCRSRADIKAIKLTPTYHNYTLADSDVVAPLVAYCKRADLPMLICIRLEDERTRYFALDIVGLPVDDVIGFCRTYPSQRVVCLNGYLPEAKVIAGACPDVGFDLSFAEWFFAVEEMLEGVAVGNLYFGSHTPFLYTQACVNKLVQSRLADDVVRKIGRGNAVEFFGLDGD